MTKITEVCGVPLAGEALQFMNLPIAERARRLGIDEAQYAMSLQLGARRNRGEKLTPMEAAVCQEAAEHFLRRANARIMASMPAPVRDDIRARYHRDPEQPQQTADVVQLRTSIRAALDAESPPDDDTILLPIG